MDSHVVLEGALLVMRDGVVAPFSDLQQRLNRKTVSPKLLRDQPAHVRLTDMLFDGTEDLRPLPYDQRRARLEAWFARTQPPRMDLSPPIAFRTWDELAELRQSARAVSIDGLMLKRADSPYVPGDSQGLCWKWQCQPLTIDAVLMYAERGQGAQACYTFGLWRGDELLPVGKTSLGLPDTEQALLDTWIRAHTTNRFGPVREVERGIVLEVAFDAAQRSTRHKSGVVLRSPRITRLRTDKPIADADQLETLIALIA
jgi:DNA ligase-1